jgi:hypothetical protein
MKHDWNATDTQGYEMQCYHCARYISIYERADWEKNVDGECPGRPEAKEGDARS